ncbi:MAG: hypothetical protein RIF32_02510 [Leptospirales bacterium]|jgi:hypothetical protein
MHQSRQNRPVRGPHCAATTFALVISILFTSACARFRIEELEPRPIFSAAVVRAELPNPEEAIHLQESGRVPFNLPVRPAVNASSAYIADPARKLVRAFSAGATDLPDMVLAGAGAAAGSAVPRINVKIGVPGWLAVDEDDETLYIQSFVRDTAPVNRSGQPIENRPSNQISLIRQIASTVLLLDVDDQYRIIGNLGVDGFDTAAFPEILRLFAEDEGVLHVLYRGEGRANQRNASSPGPLALSTYRNGTLVHRFEEFEAGAATPEEQRQYLLEWEDIVPGPGGAFAIYSVALRQKSSYDLISRRIFRRDGPEATPTELLRIDDPADYFVSSRPDGGFYLMNAEEDGSRILFKTFSPTGEYLNNRLIIFPGLRAAWRESFLDLDGRIFSSRLYLGKFELYEWN